MAVNETSATIFSALFNKVNHIQEVTHDVFAGRVVEVQLHVLEVTREVVATHGSGSVHNVRNTARLELLHVAGNCICSQVEIRVDFGTHLSCRKKTHRRSRLSMVKVHIHSEHIKTPNKNRYATRTARAIRSARLCSSVVM